MSNVIRYYSAPMMVAPNGRLIPNKGIRLPLTDANRVKLPRDFHTAIVGRFDHG